jgi:hypothetical protein
MNPRFESAWFAPVRRLSSSDEFEVGKLSRNVKIAPVRMNVIMD